MITRVIMCAKRHGRVRLSQAPGRLGMVPNPARAEKRFEHENGSELQPAKPRPQPTPELAIGRPGLRIPT